MLYVQPGLCITSENYPTYKMKEDTSLLIFSSTASWSTVGYRGGGNERNAKVGKPEFWAENLNFGQKLCACSKRPLGNQGLTHPRELKHLAGA